FPIAQVGERGRRGAEADGDGGLVFEVGQVRSLAKRPPCHPLLTHRSSSGFRSSSLLRRLDSNLRPEAARAGPSRPLVCVITTRSDAFLAGPLHPLRAAHSW